MKYVISVSKTYKHRGIRRHKKKTKKFWFIYYLDEESKLHNQQVNWFQAIWYKSRKWYKRTFYCTECKQLFTALVRPKKSKLIECPFCEE